MTNIKQKHGLEQKGNEKTKDEKSIVCRKFKNVLWETGSGNKYWPGSKLWKKGTIELQLLIF
jgi:hypothetical protein